jgi:hypothetical protein
MENDEFSGYLQALQDDAKETSKLIDLNRIENSSNEFERIFKALLDGEFTEFSISYNSHHCNYVNANYAILVGIIEIADDEWVNLDEKYIALETDSIWLARWYPNTPIGSRQLAASSFHALILGILAETK